jgi:anti-sigma B factor antagonist
MEITVRTENHATVLSLKGRLDMATGGALKTEIKKLMEKEKTQIHLNLCDVEFINSSGLGALVSILKEVRTHRGRLTLSDLASYVQEIFEITQLTHIFDIYPSEKEALRSFQPVTA